MSKQSDDIEIFKRILAKVASEYASVNSNDDRSLQFFDEVTAIFDDYIARMGIETEHAGETEPVWRRSLMIVPRAVGRLVYAANYGTMPLQNKLTEAFQAGLERQKRIKPGQRRTLNVHRMIELSDDGGCSVEVAPREAYRKAKISLAAVAVLTLAALCLVWTALSQFPVGIPASYTLGAILGWLWRDAYESAWGRDRLARRLSHQLPFLRLKEAEVSLSR
jgi:hypothetical protein